MNEMERRAQELDEFLDELAQDPNAAARENLDAATAEFARKLALTESAREAESAHSQEAQTRVWQRVSNQAEAARIARERAANSGPRRLSLFGWPWARAGFVTAAVVLVALAGLAVWATRPPSVSAQEIMQKARAAVTSPDAGGVKSFVLTEVQRAAVNSRLVAERGLKGDEQIVSETQRWYEAPNRWRSEFTQKIVAPDGKEVSRYTSVQVSDGTDVWDYTSDPNIVNVNPFDPGMNVQNQISPFGQQVTDLGTLFEQASTCFDPKVTGRAMVAGRATYVVDLGPTKCPSASVGAMNGREIIWVDQETFFVLKREIHATDSDKVLMTDEVTNVQYNVAIDPARLAFTPPANVPVSDNRPKPAPSADQYQAQLKQLAPSLDFPLFAPAYVPSNLTPLQPRMDPNLGNQAELPYVLPQDVGTSASAGPNGLTVVELKASYALVARWTQGADPVQIGAAKGWLRRGVHNADSTGSDSAALVVRDGTLVSVSSFNVTPDELVKIAASLETVPGSHASLTNPTPPTLGELRAKSSFPILVPTYVPHGLTPEPPTGGEQPGESVEIKYHRADGGIALDVVIGPTDCCPGFLQMRNEDLKLPNGTTAHLIREQTNQYGGMTLWWPQDGATIALSGPDLTQDELIKIAASMSKTAELGQVQVPDARSSPTPVPPPTFKVLRPTWFPEPMKVFEQFDGSIVTLGLDPHPDSDTTPHARMTLTEMPKSLGSGGSSDPQATQEKIGPYQVTIIHRGQGCTMMEWEAGELALSLSNVYDPPGQLRYTCEQMRKLVESIQ